MTTHITSLFLLLCHFSNTLRDITDVECPTSQDDWEKRSVKYHCRTGTLYHCLLTESYQLKEVCAKRRTLSPGKCPLLSPGDAIGGKHFECSVDLDGCPNNTDGYHSNHLFKCMYKCTEVFQLYTFLKKPIYYAPDKRCLMNPDSLKAEELRYRNKEEFEKGGYRNRTRMEEQKGEDDLLKIKPLHLLFGALGVIALLLFIIVVCIVRSCCIKRRERIHQQVDGLSSKPLHSRSHLTLYDDIYGIRVAPSMPVLRTVPSRELLYDYPIPENRSLPLLNRSIPALAELPPSRFASRQLLAPHNNVYASMEPFYIEVMDSIQTGMSASSRLSPRPPRRYDSLDKFQRFRDMNTPRGYRTMHTRRANLTIQHRRSSL